MQQVRYFVALCETLNFTRAAERCNVTQPSLTRAIKLLEDEMGGPLFARERNNTHLTELGRLMRPYLEQAMAEVEAARLKARDFRKVDTAHLSVGLMCTIGPSKLLDLIRGFRQKHADVIMQMRDARAGELQQLLVEGSLEIAILAIPGELDERLHAMPLFAERFMVTAPAEHRLARQAAVKLGDLDGEAYLCRTACEFDEHIAQLLRDSGIGVSTRYVSERDDWIQAMIAAGLGFGFTPEFAVTLPDIVARPLIEPEIRRQVHLVTVRGRPHSPAVGAFFREAMAWRARGCPPATPKAA